MGHTNNLKHRLTDHSTKQGAKFTKDTNNLEFVYAEEFSSRAEAMQREKQLKGWTKAKKLALISGDLEKLKLLSKSKRK